MMTLYWIGFAVLIVCWFVYQWIEEKREKELPQKHPDKELFDPHSSGLY
jgi:hypothetical protein